VKDKNGKEFNEMSKEEKEEFSVEVYNEYIVLKNGTIGWVHSIQENNFVAELCTKRGESGGLSNDGNWEQDIDVPFDDVERKMPKGEYELIASFERMTLDPKNFLKMVGTPAAVEFMQSITRELLENEEEKKLSFYENMIGEYVRLKEEFGVGGLVCYVNGFASKGEYPDEIHDGFDVELLEEGPELKGPELSWKSGVFVSLDSVERVMTKEEFKLKKQSILLKFKEKDEDNKK